MPDNIVTCNTYKSYWGGKLVKGDLWPEIMQGTIGGSYEGFTKYVTNHMRLFCLGIIFSSVTLLHSVVRGHDFYTHFQMCVVIFDLLPLILNNGIVGSEMRSLVGLMPVVIKFGPSN